MSVTLPKQIQDEVDRAEKLEAEIAEKAVVQEVPPEELPAEAEAEAQVSEIPEQTVAQELEPEPEVVEKPDTQAPEKWESKYRTLQSKYDVEVPRLHQQNSQLGEQLQSMQTQLTELNDRLAKPPEVVETPPSLISKDDEDVFGSDLIDLQRRVVREELAAVAPDLAKLKEQNIALKSQIDHISETTELTSVAGFNKSLKDAVPDWVEIDKEPEWLNWLAEIDPMSGLNRQAYLKNAYTQLDVNRVATIFNAYKALKNPPQTSDTKTSDLSRQVTPTRSASPSASTPASPASKMWTEDDISVALDPRTFRKLSMDDQTRLMSEIDAASAEGRVIPSG